MKSKHRFLLRAIPCLTTILAVSHPSHAATQSWIAGGTGSFQDSTKYTSGIAPVNGDIVTSDGAGSNITFDNTSPVTSLATLSLNVTSGATVFNQSSGTLSLGTLNFGGGGGSAAPAGPVKEAEYNGYLIKATPYQESGQWQTCGVVSREIGGVTKEHRFIRADRFPSQDQAADQAIVKGRQIIDQQGERMFDA